MSYCVNCGVELADSEKCCPLCGTEVLNPRRPWREPSDRPYPQTLESIISRIDRSYVAALINSLLMIPILVTLICDILSGNGITWSAYVIGAGLLIFVWVVLPLYFKCYHRLSFLAADGLALMAYVFLIERLTGGGWFLCLGLPITGAITILVLGLAYLFRRGRGRKVLMRAALLLFSIGAVAIDVEIVTDLYVCGEVYMNWSLFVVTPCLVLAAVLLIVERRQNIKEEIKKRLFY